MPRLVFGSIVLVFLAGCVFSRFSPTELLTEQVRGLNDETRWGRVDIAIDRVDAPYRNRFLSSRREWGADVRIADTELNRLILADDLMSATSMMEITWYDQRTMEVSNTVVRQHWVKRDDAFLLDEETITSGDETLFAEEEETEEEEEEEDGIMPAAG